MFRLLTAQNTQQRMDELARFIEYWYGRRQADYGESDERLARYPLPASLRRFHAFAGRWPPPPNTPHDVQFFYAGAAGHHLQPLDYIKLRPDGRLEFFMEYQGDWVGLTLPREADPPVWLEGHFEDEVSYSGPPPTRLACDSLSRFLVTHCLFTTLYEGSNCAAMAFAQADSPVAAFLHANPSKVEKIWDCTGIQCPWYSGSIYLVSEGVLIHQADNTYAFAAHPSLPGAAPLFERLKKPPGRQAGDSPNK
ncbi:MAG TPA: hypothetical protein VFA18_21045 [Gemmataceae bacterium]|nr:hypothetical protein [Gemmataceae bacterium]